MAARVMLPKCWFDATKCARGIEALKLYRSAFDDMFGVLRPGPVHDWTSHAADAFRYLAMTLDRAVVRTGFARRLDYQSGNCVMPDLPWNLRGSIGRQSMVADRVLAGIPRLVT
jgi:hypothetical protein